MKKITVLFLVAMLSMSFVACGKEQVVQNDIFETNKDLDVDQKLDAIVNADVVPKDDDTRKEQNLTSESNRLDGQDANTPDGVNENTECEYKLDGTSNMTLQDALTTKYEFSGYTKENGKIVLLLTPMEDIQEIAAFIDSLNGLTIAELKDLYEPSFGYLPLAEFCPMTAAVGDFSISFDIEHEKEVLELCKENEGLDWENLEIVQNDQISNVEIGKIFLNAPLTEESNEKLKEWETIMTGELLGMAEELVIEYVGYDLVNAER